nr:DUF4153 domain-containing protein [uncultured Flavobacterium sp.]
MEKIRALSEKVKNVLLRYPMVLAMAVLMAGTIIYMIENDWRPEKDFLPMRIILTAALGISLMFAIKMLSQRVGKELLWHGIGIILLVAYFLILPETEKDFTDVYAFVIFPVMIISHLLVSCIAFLRSEPEVKFWEFNKNLFINFVLTAIFTGVLTGGVMLAIVAVQELFNIDFKPETYGETFAFFSIIGSVFIFLLFNEKGLEYLEKEGSYPVVLKFFTQFILIPLLLIYVVILYFYSFKILFQWELPQGWVSYLILAYSILGILALLLVHPLKEDSAKSWVRIFSRLFYITLAPLIALLFTAIFTRLLEYGFTEPRYYVLLLAVWLLSVVLYFIAGKRPTIKFIPISLIIIGLFALLFPYVNAFSVAKRSQKTELENLLKEHHLVANGKIDFSKKITADVTDNISDKFEFLSERREYDYLSTFLPDTARTKLEGQQVWHIKGIFSNVAEGSAKDKSNYLDLTSKNGFAEVQDYHYIIREQDLIGKGVTIGQSHFTLESRTYFANPEYMLRLNSEEQLDLMPKIKKLIDRHKELEGIVEVDNLFVEGEIGQFHVKVIFNTLGRSTHGADTRYDFSNALFLLKDKSK